MNFPRSGACSAPDHSALIRMRDDLITRFAPADTYENMLVDAVTEAWYRLEQAYADERAWRAGRDMVEVITTKLDEYKTITRHVTDCERAWRHAIGKLERAQRDRTRQQTAPVQTLRSQPKPSAHVAPPPSGSPEHPKPGHATVSYARRE